MENATAKSTEVVPPKVPVETPKTPSATVNTPKQNISITSAHDSYFSSISSNLLFKFSNPPPAIYGTWARLRNPENNKTKWKTYYFVLDRGELHLYDKEPTLGGVCQESYLLIDYTTSMSKEDTDKNMNTLIRQHRQEKLFDSGKSTPLSTARKPSDSTRIERHIIVLAFSDEFLSTAWTNKFDEHKQWADSRMKIGK